jgi:predicted esterase
MNRFLPAKIYCCCLLIGAAVLATGAEVKWNGSFNESYLSKADGNRISFRVKTPPKAEGLKAYPLVVALKGSLRVNPSKQFPFIEVRPTRGNVWGYRAISAFDVMQVIAHLKDKYPVDPDRVYLIGSSAGGSGAMHLASLYPDQFAALVPLVAAGNNYPIANFLNLPVAFHHGAKDWTSAICDARVQYQKMKDFGCPVILQEYPNAGHSIPRPHKPIMEWLFRQRRDPQPIRVTHQCESPRLGRSYWLTIREFDNPHLPASVDASIDPNNGSILISSTNVLSLSLDRTRMPGSTANLEISGVTLPFPGKTDRFDVINIDGNWQTAERTEEAVSPSPYRAGAAANLLQGHPLLVIYGTGSASTERISALRAAAHQIAGCGGPHYAELRHRFPVVADRSLTTEQAKSCNLILIGRPDENSVTARLFRRLPIAIYNDRLHAGDRKPLPINNRILSLLHPNPEYPQRLIYIVAPFTDAEGTVRFQREAQKYLIGSDGFDRGSQGDLVVQDLNQRIARQMQFNKRWKWSGAGGVDRTLPAAFKDRAAFSVAYLTLMKRQSNADFALWWGPTDRGMWGADFNFLKRYLPGTCTRADLAIERKHFETMIGKVTGAELRQLWNRWGTVGELISSPTVTVSGLDDRKSYRLHIPMDLYIKLGQRRRNLTDPIPGPTIATAAVLASLFE